MSQQVKVGIFALLALMGIFVVYYILTNFGLHRSGYVIAVHFKNVAGLQEGNPVQLAGVTVGVVDGVSLFDDQTARVVSTINPDTKVYRQSKFIITSTFTGQTTLEITPPADLSSATLLEHGVLPENQEPLGTLPVTIANIAAEGQDRLKELDKTLTIVNRQLPILSNKLNDVATHTDKLVSHSDEAIQSLRKEFSQTLALVNATVVSTNGVIARSGRNVEALTGHLDSTVVGNQKKINALVDNLSKTADHLNQTMESIASIAQDPELKGNVVQTTANIKDASQKLKQIAADLEGITGDPTVQSQLRSAIADLSAVMAKADDILGGFSGAQPRGPAPGASASPGGTSTSPRPAPQARGGFRGLSLAQAQVRETWSNRGGGPQSDLNVTLLPRASTHVTFGANDLGYNTTYNFLIDTAASPRLTLSGGVLYSNLGAKAVFRPAGPFSLDARLYDPRRPKMDLYGDLRLGQRLELFYGRRHLLGPLPRDPAFGLQATY